jgi:hypothetical protein
MAGGGMVIPALAVFSKNKFFERPQAELSNRRVP